MRKNGATLERRFYVFHILEAYKMINCHYSNDSTAVYTVCTYLPHRQYRPCFEWASDIDKAFICNLYWSKRKVCAIPERVDEFHETRASMVLNPSSSRNDNLDKMDNKDDMDSMGSMDRMESMVNMDNMDEMDSMDRVENGNQNIQSRESELAVYIWTN